MLRSLPSPYENNNLEGKPAGAHGLPPVMINRSTLIVLGADMRRQGSPSEQARCSRVGHLLADLFGVRIVWFHHLARTSVSGMMVGAPEGTVAVLALIASTRKAAG